MNLSQYFAYILSVFRFEQSVCNPVGQAWRIADLFVKKNNHPTKNKSRSCARKCLALELVWFAAAPVLASKLKLLSSFRNALRNHICALLFLCRAVVLLIKFPLALVALFFILDTHLPVCGFSFW